MAVLITGSGLVGSQIARLEVERGERPVILELAIVEFREMKMQPALERAQKHKGLLGA